MPYREPAPEWVGVRIGEIAREVDRVDQAIAEWSRRVPDGRDAPPEVDALFRYKESPMTELLGLHAQYRR